MSNFPDKSINVSDCSGGCRIMVKAKPGARKEGITGLHDGALRIGINAAPEKGKANQALSKYLAKLFGVAAGKIEIVNGHTSSQKVFFIPLQSKRVLEILHEREPDL